MICPDISIGDEFYLQNDFSHPTNSFYEFKIDKCNPKLHQDCKDDTEIDKKIRQIEVDTYQLKSMMDY